MKYQTPDVNGSQSNTYPGGLCSGQEALGPARQKKSDIGPGPSIPKGAGKTSSKGSISYPKTPGSYGPNTK